MKRIVMLSLVLALLVATVISGTALAGGNGGPAYGPGGPGYGPGGPCYCYCVGEKCTCDCTCDGGCPQP